MNNFFNKEIKFLSFLDRNPKSEKVEIIILSIFFIIISLIYLIFCTKDRPLLTELRLNKAENSIVIKNLLPPQKAKNLGKLSDIKNVSTIKDYRVGISKQPVSCYNIQLNSSYENIKPIPFCNSKEEKTEKIKTDIDDFLKSDSNIYKIKQFSVYNLIWELAAIAVLILFINTLVRNFKTLVKK